MSLEVYQKNYNFQWNEIEKNSGVFRHKASTAVMSMANDILDNLMNGTEGRLALAGEEGCGKTALFSYVCEELKQKGWTVLPVLCCTTVCGTSPIEVMKNLVWQMETVAKVERTLDYDKLGEVAAYAGVNYVMGNNHRALTELQNRFAELCTKFTTELGKHLIIAVDGLDRCFQGRAWEETEFIPHLVTKHIRVFATCQQDCVSPEDVVRMSIPEFSAGKVSSAWKQIPKTGLKAYCDAQEAVDKELLQDVCEYLAVAPEGASLAELAALSKLAGKEVTEEALQAVLDAVSECFAMRSDGRFVLAHTSIRTGILASSVRKQERLKCYAEYRKAQELTDAWSVRGLTTALIQADEKDALIELVISMAQENRKLFYYPVAEELFTYIYSTGNKWIEAVAKELQESERTNEDKLNFVNFFAFQVWDCFVGIPKEALYKKRLAEILISIVEKCLEEKETVMGHFLCGMLYDFMGEILYWVNGPERPDKALAWYEKEAGVYEHMLREYGPAHMGSLRGAYDKLERIYIRLGGAENLEKAEYYLQKETVLSEKTWAVTRAKDEFLMLSLSLEKLGDFLLEKGGKENLEQALMCAKRALSIRAVLSQGLPDPLESLPVSYAKISDVFYRMGGAENIKQALEFRETQIRLIKRIMKRNRSEKLLQELSAAYNSLGGLYLEQGGPENLEKAQKNFEESFKVMEELLEKTGTVGSLRNLYVGYYKLGDVYAYYGERDTLVAARHYFSMAKEICERLNAELKTEESKEDLMFINHQLKSLQTRLENYGKKGKTLADKAIEEGVSVVTLKEQYRKDGEAYEEKGGKENLLLAIEQYKAELSLLQNESAEENTSEKRLEVAEAHLRIGSVHEQIDERDELHNAMRHYTTALQLFYQLDQESSGIRTQRALATAYIYKSNCCEKMGTREDTWIAREGYLQAKAIREKIYDKLHDEQSRKELVYCENQIERLEKLIKDSVPVTPAD